MHPPRYFDKILSLVPGLQILSLCIESHPQWGCNRRAGYERLPPRTLQGFSKAWLQFSTMRRQTVCCRSKVCGMNVSCGAVTATSRCTIRIQTTNLSLNGTAYHRLRKGCILSDSCSFSWTVCSRGLIRQCWTIQMCPRAFP